MVAVYMYLIKEKCAGYLYSGSDTGNYIVV